MSDSVKNKVLVIGGWNYIALLILCIGIFVLWQKANKNKSYKTFIIVELAMVIWLVGKVFKTVSPTEELRWAFIVVYYFGICLLEVSFFDFSYVYLKEKYMSRYVRILIYLIGLSQFFVVATNPIHYLFYSEYSFWGDDFGPLFYFHVVINYTAILTGLVLCTLKFVKQVKEESRLKKSLISIAIIIPLILNFVYISQNLKRIFRYFGWQIFDITPIVYTFTLMVFVYATFKYEFFDLSPIMKHEITEKLNSGICVTDLGGQVLYLNRYMKNHFPIEVQDNIRLHFKIEDDLLWQENEVFQYEKQIMRDYSGTFHVHLFTDITYYQGLSDQIDEKRKNISLSNQKLKEQIDVVLKTSEKAASNFVARELHDIIGHSLVVAMKLLESSKILVSDNLKSSRLIHQSKTALEEGVKEINSLCVREQVMTTNALKIEVHSMLKPIINSGVQVKFFSEMLQLKIDQRIYTVVLKVTKELLTNVLKHASCSLILIQLKTKGNCLSIQVMDNGQGVDQILVGNGIKGIRERLKSVGGIYNYSSNLHEGFSSEIILPINQ